MHDFDVAIIGTGQGGVPLAIDLAAAGKRVVVFERGKLGGSCVNVGCTPSKAFLASAHAAGRARRAADIGVKADVRVDFPAVMERVRAVVADWNGGVEAKFAKHPAIELVRAEAAFAGPHTLAAAGEHYTAATIVVDTGTRPAIPQIAGIAGLPVLDESDIFRPNRAAASHLGDRRGLHRARAGPRAGTLRQRGPHRAQRRARAHQRGARRFSGAAAVVRARRDHAPPRRDHDGRHVRRHDVRAGIGRRLAGRRGSAARRCRPRPEHSGRRRGGRDRAGRARLYRRRRASADVGSRRVRAGRRRRANRNLRTSRGRTTGGSRRSWAAICPHAPTACWATPSSPIRRSAGSDSPTRRRCRPGTRSAASRSSSRTSPGPSNGTNERVLSHGRRYNKQHDSRSDARRL